jgi:hypothetical protein
MPAVLGGLALVDGVEDLLDGLSLAAGLEDPRLSRTLGPQDLGLLLALGGEDRRLLGALGREDAARLSRSARICFSIESCTECGGSMALSSTRLTRMPQRPVSCRERHAVVR